MAKKKRLNYKLVSLVLFVAIIVILQVKFNAFEGLFRSQSAVEEERTTEIVVATVNGERITLTDVETIYATLSPEEGITKNEVLLQLINQTVLVSKAKGMGVDIEQWEIDELMSQYKLFFGGEDQFNEILRETNLTEEILKRSLKNQLLISRLFEEFYFPFIELEEEEVNEFIALYLSDEEGFEIDNETLSEVRVFLKDMKKESTFQRVLAESLFEAEIFIHYDFESGSEIMRELVFDEMPAEADTDPSIILPEDIELVIVDDEEMAEEEQQPDEEITEEHEEEDEAGKQELELIEVSAYADPEAKTLTIEGKATANVEEVSVGALRWVDEIEYDGESFGHKAFMLDVINGTFSITLVEGEEWPGGEEWHKLQPGRHKIRAVIIDEEGDMLSFMDSKDFFIEENEEEIEEESEDDKEQNDEEEL
ncbi:MAG TPA: hypothetical protein ENN46_04785 [Candidatus Woesearchaeota archaeon]|nr:hypothetical protein [Candidatus Woesearchaeota archaeon]